MAIFGITLRYAWFAVPIAGFLLGKYVDDEETLRMISYRDKSQLYGTQGKEKSPPTWP